MTKAAVVLFTRLISLRTCLGNRLIGHNDVAGQITALLSKARNGLDRDFDVRHL